MSCLAIKIEGRVGGLRKLVIAWRPAGNQHHLFFSSSFLNLLNCLYLNSRVGFAFHIPSAIPPSGQVSKQLVGAYLLAEVKPPQLGSIWAREKHSSFTVSTSDDAFCLQRTSEIVPKVIKFCFEPVHVLLLNTRTWPQLLWGTKSSTRSVGVYRTRIQRHKRMVCAVCSPRVNVATESWRNTYKKFKLYHMGHCLH